MSASSLIVLHAVRVHARPPLRVEVRSYRYNGPHRNWNPATKRVEWGFVHYEWRWKIRYHGKVVQSRQSFCSYQGARDSAERAMSYWTAVLCG